jgi:hypothetical protein
MSSHGRRERDKDSAKHSYSWKYLTCYQGFRILFKTSKYQVYFSEVTLDAMLNSEPMRSFLPARLICIKNL